jgi:hypothetical protein
MDRMRLAHNYLRTLHDHVDEPHVRSGPGCFASQEGIDVRCPNCGAEYVNQNVDWVAETLGRLCDQSTKTFPSFNAEAPCCGAIIDMSKAPLPMGRDRTDPAWAGYCHWGFATADICLWNFRGPFTPAQRAELERLLDCPVRFIAHKF